MLQVLKLPIDQAISGEEAVMKCRQRMEKGIDMYNLIIMDINMPGMDGVETTKALRQFLDTYVRDRNQKCMIVAHTALPEYQFGDYKAKGFDDFLQKNDNEHLRQIV